MLQQRRTISTWHRYESVDLYDPLSSTLLNYPTWMLIGFHTFVPITMYFSPFDKCTRFAIVNTWNWFTVLLETRANREVGLTDCYRNFVLKHRAKDASHWSDCQKKVTFWNRPWLSIPVLNPQLDEQTPFHSIWWQHQCHRQVRNNIFWLLVYSTMILSHS